MDFLELVSSCHIIAAGMHFFGLNTVDDQPRFNSFPIGKQSNENSQWKALSGVLGKFVDRYIIVQRFQELQPQHPVPRLLLTQEYYNNPHATRIHMEHSYCVQISTQVASEHCYTGVTKEPLASAKCRKLPQSLRTSMDVPHAANSVCENMPDGVFNYACSVLNDSMLLVELRDAIHEGDGPRILRCWKFMLIYYRYAKHYKYALEAFILLAQVNVLASSRVKNQLTWSRVVNTRGGAGNNIPVDLHNEHLNRKLKDIVCGVGANVNEELIVEASKSLHAVDSICEHFDTITSIRPDSVHHTRKSCEQDMKAIVKQLSESQVFSYIPGRKHRAFPNIKPNLVRSTDTKALFEWIHQKQKDLANKVTFQNIFRM